jgi:Zn-dependent peptidase ImmA (M78 family)
MGVLVFQLPMGSDACRGFSVWDRHAPLIVANTWWNPAARTFTLLHELGHLLTRTSSARLGPTIAPSIRGGDPTERWCEEFAAALLLPKSEVIEHLVLKFGWHQGEKITDLRPIRSLAAKLNASLSATALRLIKAGIAVPQLYGAIPYTSDRKRKGGGGGGRRRYEARRDQLGSRPVQILLEAAASGLLSTSEVLGYLDVDYTELDLLARTVEQATRSA